MIHVCSELTSVYLLPLSLSASAGPAELRRGPPAASAGPEETRHGHAVVRGDRDQLGRSGQRSQLHSGLPGHQQRPATQGETIYFFQWP